MIETISLGAFSGSLGFSDHYHQQLLDRPTPSEDEIHFLLVEDDPEIIEDYPRDPRGGSCLIWGTTDSDGRIGHVVCAYPPNLTVITAYFPADTEPDEWESNYRTRRLTE